MDSKTSKILNRRWNGASYRKGGERVAVVRDRAQAVADRRDALAPGPDDQPHRRVKRDPPPRPWSPFDPVEYDD